MFTPICKFLYIIYIFSKCESLNVTTYCDVHPGYKWDYFVHIYPNKIVSEFSGFPGFSYQFRVHNYGTSCKIFQQWSPKPYSSVYLKRMCFILFNQKYTLSQSISYFIFTKIFQMNVLHTLSKKSVLLLSLPKKARVVQ